MNRRVATVTPARSGGWLLSDGSAFPQWFPDWRTAYAEVHARNPISPAGSSDRLVLGIPPQQPAGVRSTFVASGGEVVAGDSDPRTPATTTTTEAAV